MKVSALMKDNTWNITACFLKRELMYYSYSYKVGGDRDDRCACTNVPAISVILSYFFFNGFAVAVRL